MESQNLYLFLILGLHFIALSHTKSIINNLPGYSGDLPFVLETGYIGVGANEEVQAFYYFVESGRNPPQDPLLFYLTGGPGTSGLYPFLYQLGPLRFNTEIPSTVNITLELNPYAWTKTANMIFVDLPAGSGFSYAKTWNASRGSDSLVVSQSSEFIRKWLIEHPNFLSNPLYIAGTSYMGIVVPIVTLELYNGNEVGTQPEVNIKGYLILSPLTDKFSDFNARVKFAHRAALISDDIYESAKKSCKGNYINVQPSNALCANCLQRVDECVSMINLENILEPMCAAGQTNATCPEVDTLYAEAWANDEAVRKALHVRQGTIGTWVCKNNSIHYDFQKNDTVYYAYDIFSSFDYHAKLTNKSCQALVISGDHDMTFPYVGTEKWIKNLNLTVKSAWKPWFVQNQVAGYQMTHGNNKYALKYATCKGAGHSIPLYTPEECLYMVDTWLSSQTTTTRPFAAI